MIGSGWPNGCADELISNGWIECFVAVFEEVDESGGSRGSRAAKTRTVTSPKPFTKAQLAQIQREDEELVAIVAVIGRAIL